MFLEWIFSIVGIGAIGILLDVLMPEGETNKYIKSIFALITICVVISPLPKLVGQKLDFTFFGDNTSAIDVDTKFVENVFSSRYDKIASQIETSIYSLCGQNVDVKINFVESCPEKIEEVIVFSKNLVIEKGDENKHIIEKINSLLKTKLGVQGEQIIYKDG